MFHSAKTSFNIFSPSFISVFVIFKGGNRRSLSCAVKIKSPFDIHASAKARTDFSERTFTPSINPAPVTASTHFILEIKVFK